MTVGVLVDSSSDLNFEKAEEIGIHLLLQSVQFAGKSWLDRSELSSEEVFRQVKAGAPLPTANPISVASYQKTLERLLQRHSHVFALHPSLYLGENLQVAKQAVVDFGGRVTLYESRYISGVLAMQAERAARLLRQGIAPALVSELLKTLEAQVQAYSCLNTPEIARQSLRLTDARSVLGAMVNARQVVTSRDDKVVVVGTAVSHAAAINLMRQQLRKAATSVSAPRIAYWSNGYPEGLAALRAEANALGVQEIFELQMDAVLSTHAGPQAYGFGIEPTNVWYNFRSY